MGLLPELSSPDERPVPRVSGAIKALHDRCGVYTRSSIVHEILDSVRWTSDADLSGARLLEPAAGDGAFVLIAAERLIASFQKRGRKISLATLGDKILAYEIHPTEGRLARTRLISVLKTLGVPSSTSRALANRWIVIGDFLLAQIPTAAFTHVVGNPPYSRWSKIPPSLRKRYEKHLPKRMIKGDLFLPFLDLSLGYLRKDARLGFLCSDRWRFMAFAHAFRREWLPRITVELDAPLTSEAAYVDPVDVYPSILVIRNRQPKSQSVASISKPISLAEAGYEVRVGPALGFAAAYLLESNDHDIEPEIVAPWFDGTEIEENNIRWKGRNIIVMHDDKGSLRRLQDFPNAAVRLKKHRARLSLRSIVRAGAPWYRPIDRVVAATWARPKIVLPELAKIPRVALDRSGAIPSHGVYAIFAPNDDLTELYGFLRNGGLSRALEPVAPKIKGGYIRCYRRFLEKIPLV